MILKGKLEELEHWMNSVINPTNSKLYSIASEHPELVPRLIEVKLCEGINDKLIRKLKETLVAEFDKPSRTMSLGCARSRGIYDTYFSDVSVERFLGWLQTYPEFKERWGDLNGFLNEIKKYVPQDESDYINCAIDFINTHEKIHLHKPSKFHNDAFGELKISLNEGFFVCSQREQADTIMKSLPLCLGIHNNRCIFAIDEYVVGCSFETMAKKFTVIRQLKKTQKECTLTDKEANILTELIFDFAHYTNVLLKRRAVYPRIITFEAVDNALHENISTKIKALWDDELHAIDIRTNTPLTESYMTMLGYLFSPINKSERVCLSFYSTASGFGKTSFIENICERIDVNLGTLVSSCGKANQFTFSYAIAEGPDILRADDPMKSTDDILSLVSRLVSDHSAPCELKGGAVKTVKDLYTKVLITSNVPLYMKNDTNNFLTEKLFELRTNEIEHCSNDERVADINNYIETCSDSEINNFLTKCINMYNNNPDWLKQHKGQYQDKDEIGCKFALIDFNKLRDKNNKTLLDCKADDVVGYDILRHTAYDDVQTQWNVMCKYIKTTWPMLADVCKCSVPLNSGIFSPTVRIAPNRFKNYVLNDELRAKIIECINDGCTDTTLTCSCLAATRCTNTCEGGVSLQTYNGDYEDLFNEL